MRRWGTDMQKLESYYARRLLAILAVNQPAPSLPQHTHMHPTPPKRGASSFHFGFARRWAPGHGASST